MTSLISFPFRLGSGGAVQTVQEGTDAYYEEQLAVLIMTHPGERVLVPDFGITDPTFYEFDQAELQTKIIIFGPPVNVTDVVASYPREGLLNVRVEFDSPTALDF